MARMFLDLEHLESVSASVGTTDKGIHAQARVVISEGNRNLAYGIVRTAPLSQRSLAHVPAGAAAVAVVGLNPPAKASDDSSPKTPSLTAMDIGREVFANVEEISVFVLPAVPSDAARAMPEVGMVAAVKDPAKSEALWDQLLSLASMFGPQIAQPPQEVEIEGRKAKQYQFQGAPPIVVVRLADRSLAAGTRGAVSAAIKAEGPNAITGDPQFQPLVAGLKPESSKAILVNVGRSVGIAATTAPPRDRATAQQIASLLGDLKVMVVTNEQPNELVIRASATGLPNVPNIVQAVAGAALARRPLGVQAPPRAVRIARPIEVQPPSPPQRTDNSAPAAPKQ